MANAMMVHPGDDGKTKGQTAQDKPAHLPAASHVGVVDGRSPAVSMGLVVRPGAAAAAGVLLHHLQP